MFGKICPPEVAKAVHRLRSEDKTLKQVASYFGHGEEWARRIMLNYDEASGLPKFTPKFPGRPRKTTLEEDGKMLELARGDDARPSSGQIATAMKDCGTAISSSTVRRRLRDSHVCRRKHPDFCSFSTLLSARDRAGLFRRKFVGYFINQSINQSIHSLWIVGLFAVKSVNQPLTWTKSNLLKSINQSTDEKWVDLLVSSFRTWVDYMIHDMHCFCFCFSSYLENSVANSPVEEGIGPEESGHQDSPQGRQTRQRHRHPGDHQGSTGQEIKPFPRGSRRRRSAKFWRAIYAPKRRQVRWIP